MNQKSILTGRSLRRMNIVIIALLFCGLARIGSAQEFKIDINELTRETQQITQGAGAMTIIWWIPEEFWQASFTQNPAITKEQIEAFIEVLRPYTLIAVVDGNTGPFGTIVYKPEPEIRASIQIKDSQGLGYSPLSDDKINLDAKNFLSMMKPALSNMLGPMGQNMHFYLFPGRNNMGQSIADAKTEGFFSVLLTGKEFRWKLPLGALIPSKICPECQEECEGTWQFCPWCGTKLP